MRILAIHGVGHGDARSDWQPGWRSAIGDGLKAWNRNAAPQIEFLGYDHFFEQHELGAPAVTEALVRLAASGLFYGITDLFRSPRGFADMLEGVRWSAGMVAQWVAIEELRAQLRSLLAAKIRSFQPDVIAAHSLGSLIAYDLFKRDETAHRAAPLCDGRTLLTFGSQIGNAAVRAIFGGRIGAVRSARFWWHLYNEEDDAFTGPVHLPDPERFRQVDTLFDIEGWADHDGAQYLAHAEAVQTVWQDLASTIARGRSMAPAPVSLASAHRRAARAEARAAPQMRALLVGVADYPDAASRLDGPVNDVFSVSAALQDLGFPADGIRVVLNDRATAAGIRERLKWLLANARPGDTLVFFYAGHGAQIPGYGRDAEVDRLDECLAPYDFDWSRGRAITDDEFCALYSQLPYEAQFTAMFDCCHAGGMARSGGARARGLSPPDDIRHRTIRWDRDLQMWLPRKALATRPDAQNRVKRSADREAWTGSSGAVRRLGRASALWLPTDRDYRRALKATGHKGPYTPVLLEACAEGESAYEYRHGVTSHGAFTFALCAVLREAARRRTRRPLTFSGLIEQTAARIRAVVADPQYPQLLCPEERLKQPIPGLRR